MNNIFTILYRALTYGENWWFTVLNYVVLLVVLIPFWTTKLKITVKKWWVVLLVSFVIQAVFWFVLRVQGISIIWNAMLGLLLFYIFRFRLKRNKTDYPIVFTICIALAADVYFAFIAPLITTIAHISAILLVIVCALIIIGKKDKQQ